MTTLAELRQASLKEQKQKEQMQCTPEKASEHVAPVPVLSDNAVTSLKTNGHHALAPEASVPAPTPVAAAPVLPPAVPPPAPAPSAEAIQGERFFMQIHASLSHKTLHANGAKVSADMPPALFHRAKRYCLDHGNITLRQVMIDLLTQYLEAEGY